MMLRWNSVRITARLPKLCAYSTVSTSPQNADIERLKDLGLKKTPQLDESASEKHSTLVAAAFASLESIKRKSKASASSIDFLLDTTEDVDKLLSIAEQPVIARRHAFKVMSKLSCWIRENKCSLNDFSKDPRFAKICKVLGSFPPPTEEKFSDLSIVLNVAADDQAAKLIDSVDLSQMVKILSSLGHKKRRSIALLRSLSFNIAKSSELMNIKQAADVLYACASLNYVDEVLLDRTIADILMCLENNDKASVVKSIAISIGILRYRYTNLLENICTWFIENAKLCSSKEASSILYTLANLNYVPSNFDRFMKTSKQFLSVDGVDSGVWIDTVWSLVVLDHCDNELVNSVLCPEFLRKVTVQHRNEDIALKLKLLNINGYAKLQKNYKGSLLDETSLIFDIPLSRSAEERRNFNSLIETINNLVTTQDFVRVDVDTKMGFVIDAEMLIDAERNFVKSSSSVKNVTKVAVMMSNYHDMCRGCSDQPTGITALVYRLIEKLGYKLLCVPYNEFNPKEKLITRIQYLSKKLEMLD